MTEPFAIAIGASAGGVEPLLQIVGSLPAGLPAIVLVTLHIGNYRSVLPELMRARGAKHAMHPADGDRPVPGAIYIAPPDRHLLLDGDSLRLLRGPRENFCRPAIDPMFRSVAISMRSRVIGVVLTGQLDDGTAGLQAIKKCGGIAIVQDPATAPEPSMPLNALANVAVDYTLRVDEMVPAFERIIAKKRAPATDPVPDTSQREQQIMDGREPMQNLRAIAEPSSLTCPECGGGLWELKEEKPLRYRCHTGHGYSAQTLQHAHTETTEHALWSSVRTLQEKEILLRRVARISRAHGDHAQAEAGEKQADRAREQAQQLVEMIEKGGGA